MKMDRPKTMLFAILFLSLLTIYRVFAIDPSQAGGGWLEVSKPGGYTFVANHEDFGKNIAKEFTLEMWFYMKRTLQRDEVWMLLDKEGSYSLRLAYNHNVPFEERPIIISFHYTYLNGSGTWGILYFENEIPSNQWHHIAYVHDENGYQLYVDGEGILDNKIFHINQILDYTNDPLYIGGTGVDLNRYRSVKSLVQFSEGFIDEVRISDKARYPVKDEIIPIKIAVPQGRFEPDENTLALWHFDGDKAEWLKYASGHEHTLTAMNLNYYSVGIHEKLPTVWGQIKR